VIDRSNCRAQRPQARQCPPCKTRPRTRERASSTLGTTGKKRGTSCRRCLSPRITFKWLRPGKRGLETKVISVPCKRFHFFRASAATRERRGCFRRKGRQSLRRSGPHYKISAVRVLRQNSARKGSLARAIRSRDNVDIWAHENSEAYIQLPRFASRFAFLPECELEFEASSSRLALYTPSPHGYSRIGGQFSLSLASNSHKMPSYPQHANDLAVIS